MTGLILGAGGGSADTSSITATAADVIAPAKIIDKDGNLVTGTIQNAGPIVYTPGSSSRTWTDIYSPSLKVNAVQTQAKMAYPAFGDVEVLPDEGKFLSSVTVYGIKKITDTTASLSKRSSYTLTTALTLSNDDKVVGLLIQKNDLMFTDSYHRLFNGFAFDISGFSLDNAFYANSSSYIMSSTANPVRDGLRMTITSLAPLKIKFENIEFAPDQPSGYFYGVYIISIWYCKGMTDQ